MPTDLFGCHYCTSSGLVAPFFHTTPAWLSTKPVQEARRDPRVAWHDAVLYSFPYFSPWATASNSPPQSWSVRKLVQSTTGPRHRPPGCRVSGATATTCGPTTAGVLRVRLLDDAVPVVGVWQILVNRPPT